MPNKQAPSLGVEVFKTPAGELAIAQIEDSPDAERIVFLRVDEIPYLIDMLKRELSAEEDELLESLPPRPRHMN